MAKACYDRVCQSNAVKLQRLWIVAHHAPLGGPNYRNLGIEHALAMPAFLLTFFCPEQFCPITLGYDCGLPVLHPQDHCGFYLVAVISMGPCPAGFCADHENIRAASNILVTRTAACDDCLAAPTSSSEVELPGEAENGAFKVN
jgi:hypothetical protein